MTRKDYHVRLTATFWFDVAATDRISAEKNAVFITRSVFRNDFSRAEDVTVDAKAEPLAEREKQR